MPVQRACPCGSGQVYDACCEPLHDGARANTAEQLMRSRYAAFVLHREDHLFRTWHPRTRPDDLSVSPTTTWLGLDVLATTAGGPDDDTGTVEFAAYSDLGGHSHTPHTLHETSRFERRAGRWVYVDGDLHPDGATHGRLRRGPNGRSAT